MRIDLKHLVAKGQARKLVDKVMAYAKLMQSQGKPVDRIIVSAVQYEMLRKLASSYGRVVLCCGDALVYYNHDPIDESEPVHEPRAVKRYDSGLPPVDANPFGVPDPTTAISCMPPGPTVRDVMEEFDDDDIPF